MNKKLILLSLLFLIFNACGSSSVGVIPPPSLSSSNSLCQNSQLKAFPEAEGFGACASGGRGGRVIYVTNLEADPRGEIPGSLQWALNQSGKRYILFKVSGTINGTVTLQKGDVTIAGQTSPAGIIVRGFNIEGDNVCESDTCALPSIYPQNFILRHLRSRVVGGPASSYIDQDALRLHHAVNGIIDHFSAENAPDEAMQISFSKDITIQNSILAETIGGHAQYGGMLINYSDPARGFPLDRLSIHHNIWNRILGRYPEISRDNPGANQTVLNIEVSNNLIWDPAFFMTVAIHQPTNPSALLYYHLNVVGNSFIARPSATDGLGNFTYGLMDSSFLQDLPAMHPTTTYFSGNSINLYPGYHDYQLLYRDNNFPSVLTGMEALPFPDPTHPPSFARASRHEFPAITSVPVSELRSYMLTKAGAFPRDVMDRRLMDFVNSQVFDTNPRNINPYNDAFLIPNIIEGSSLDSDEDGIPDEWENTHGLNPHVADQNTIDPVSSYPMIELYLNELALQQMGG